LDDECKALLERLAALARLEPREEYCGDIEKVRGFLEGLSQARGEVEGLEPLYHVWEKESRLRGEKEEGYPPVDIGELLPPDRLEDGHVRIPWKGH